MKKVLSLIFVLTLMLGLLAGCGESGGNGKETTVELTGDNAAIQGDGCSFKDGVLSITGAGTYTLSGELRGSILVDAGNAQDDVILVLNGVNVENPDGAAIYVQQAKNTRIELKEGSENSLISGTEGSPFDEQNAKGSVIFSEDDLDIEGTGSLNIKGYINNGIGCKDDLDINSGNITVLAVNNGIRASESFELKGGKLSVTAGNDGIKTSSNKKEGKGFITISGGEAEITAEGDGISSAAEVTLEDGIINITAKGGDGIKALDVLNITGGNAEINAADNGVKALNAVIISGGKLNVISAGDGIQAGDSKISSVKKIEQSGGEIYVSAYKQGLNSDEIELTGGMALVLQNEELYDVENIANVPMLAGEFEASKGSTVSVESFAQIQSGTACRCVIFTHPELQSGNEYSLSNGVKSFTLTAK